MKFNGIGERSGSYVTFKFDNHERFDVIVGDQIWSDGSNIAIYESAGIEIVEGLIEMVKNKNSFKGALRRMEIIK